MSDDNDDEPLTLDMAQELLDGMKKELVRTLAAIVRAHTDQEIQLQKEYHAGLVRLDEMEAGLTRLMPSIASNATAVTQYAQRMDAIVSDLANRVAVLEARERTG